MPNPEHQIKKILTKLIFDHCFYGQLVMTRLEISSNPALKFGMATDGINLWYSPAWIEKTPEWELESVTVHEVVHCANGHPWRREGRDSKLWNIAADHVTNLILVEDGFKLWKGAYCDERFKGWSVEQVYGQLLEEKRQAQQQKQQEQEQQAGSGASQEPDDDEQNDETNEQDEPEEDGDGSEQGDESEDAGNEPSDAPGADSQEDDDDDNPQPGAMIDPPAGTADPDTLEAEWSVAVFNAAQAAAAAGKLPAGLKQLLKEKREPKVEWIPILRRWAQNCSKNDYSWQTPDPDFLHLGLYMPALTSESLPAAGILWDTSGSRDYDEARKECAGEVTSIIEDCHPERLYVIYSDAKVQKVEEFEPNDPIVFNPVGGGGTMFKPAFDHIAKEGWPLAFLIVITDLDIFDLDTIKDPGFPVIWLKIGGFRQTVPFGEILEVEPEHRHAY